MAFDSGYNTDAAIFVSATWAYPILAIAFSIIAWFYYSKAKFNLAITSMAIPLTYPILYFLVLALISEAV